MLKVHFHLNASAPRLAALQQRHWPQIQYTHSTKLPQPADYQILVNAFPTREQLVASPNLHTVIIPFTGIPAAARELMLEFSHLNLHNIPYNIEATGETALALMLAAAKFIVPTDRKLRQNDWSPRYSDCPQIVLNRKTMLILGYGKIGRHIGKVGNALGLHVLGVRRSQQNSPQIDEYAEIYSIDQLPMLLPRANILICVLPDTEETRGLIGADQLALLPDAAIVVNVGRGGIIDETALYTALHNRKLAGAGLDVWYNYPRTVEARTNTPPSQYPFHELDNVVMSPHRSGWIGVDEEARLHILEEQLNAAAEGRPIPYKIDPIRGY